MLAGEATLIAEGRAPARIRRDDALVRPAGLAHAFDAASSDLEHLEVELPLSATR